MGSFSTSDGIITVEQEEEAVVAIEYRDPVGGVQCMVLAIEDVPAMIRELSAELGSAFKAMLAVAPEYCMECGWRHAAGEPCIPDDDDGVKTP